MPSVTIRQARPSDAATIVRLVRELAAFEGLLDQVRLTAVDVLRDGFGERPRFECLLAEVDGAAVAFVLYFEDYSTFEGRSGIFVEDLYVAEAARGRGIGRRLLARLAQLAIERDCRRLDLCVLHWNPARGFYERLGFLHSSDWLPYRVTGDALARLASED
ncbi:MAG: GNAT family N-acetyltransferase [Geminicoccaceae bacterium]